jgi:hypothetical protein
MRTLLAITALSLGLLASQAADDQPQPKPAAPLDAAAKRAEMIKKYDKNGDGRLDAQESAAYKKDRDAEMLKKYDKNGDGKIDEAERQVAQDDIKKQRQAVIAQRQAELKKEEKK